MEYNEDQLIVALKEALPKNLKTILEMLLLDKYVELMLNYYCKNYTYEELQYKMKISYSKVFNDIKKCRKKILIALNDSYYQDIIKGLLHMK